LSDIHLIGPPRALLKQTKNPQYFFISPRTLKRWSPNSQNLSNYLSLAWFEVVLKEVLSLYLVINFFDRFLNQRKCLYPFKNSENKFIHISFFMSHKKHSIEEQ
jgi:hypothetical protein